MGHLITEKTYLGDGCYVKFDGYYIILTTNNGIIDTNTIYLEREVFENLIEFTNKLRKAFIEQNMGIEK